METDFDQEKRIMFIQGRINLCFLQTT